MSNLSFGRTLAKSITGSFTVGRVCGIYNVYHKEDGFLTQCRTQRQIRNVMRAYTVNKTITTEGRE